MYSSEEYTYTEPVYGAEVPESRSSRKPRRRKRSFFRRAAAFVLCAVLFGGIAGGSFYGMSILLGGDSSSGESGSAEVSAASLSNVSYNTSASSGQSLDVSDIAALGLPSVVSVTNISVQEVQSYFGQFGRDGRGQVQLQETTSCGSGVIIYASESCLYIVTNYHVVEGATTLSVTFVDDETYEAELCGYDDSIDIALLKVAISELSENTLSQIAVVTIGSSDELVVGEQVVAIGNALGYGQSVTTGIVSALNRYVSTSVTTAAYIQTDAAINPGNSGGALFNMNGELVGINTAKVSSTGVEGMGYAIPISQVLGIIESMID